MIEQCFEREIDQEFLYFALKSFWILKQKIHIQQRHFVLLFSEIVVKQFVIAEIEFFAEESSYPGAFSAMDVM